MKSAGAVLLGKGNRENVFAYLQRASMIIYTGRPIEELNPECILCGQVAKLKGAGAVLLGKGNMGEWAFSPTFSLSSDCGSGEESVRPR